MNSFYENLLSERGQYDLLWEENIKILCSAGGTLGSAERKFFNQYWEGWGFSVILGIQNNRKISLEGQKNQWGELRIIRNANEETLKGIILLALSTVDNIDEYLDDSKKLINLMNEYAKGGAAIVSEIRSSPGQENYFNSEDDFLHELTSRVSNQDEAHL